MRAIGIVAGEYSKFPMEQSVHPLKEFDSVEDLLSRLTDCCNKVLEKCAEDEYNEGLNIINTFPYPAEQHPLLSEVKVRCLKALGHNDLALTCFATNLESRMYATKYDDVLKALQICEFDVESNPKLLEIRTTCTSILNESEPVAVCYKKASKLFKRKLYLRAVSMITSSGFDPARHPCLSELLIDSLRAANKHSDAVVYAAAFWEGKFQQPLNVYLALGESLKAERALEFFKGLCLDYDIPEADRMKYRKRMEEIREEEANIKKASKPRKKGRATEIKPEEKVEDIKPEEKVEDIKPEVKEVKEADNEEKCEEKREAENVVVEVKENVEFKVEFVITRERSSGKYSFCGPTKSNVTTVRKSLVEAQDHQLKKFQELVTLCSEHESLLRVEHAIKDCRNTIFMVTEVVDSVDHFFGLKFQRQKMPLTNQIWWSEIEEQFWIIFRDVIRGLMHLFMSNLTCGDLAFGVFVTAKGRGRILPSLTNGNALNDLKELSKLMKGIIQLPEGRSNLDFLPIGLRSFFDHIDRGNVLLKEIPSAFLIDHPYFRSIAEKIDFSLKLRKILKTPTEARKPSVRSSLKQALNELSLSLYQHWSAQLVGVYRQIFLKPPSTTATNTATRIQQRYGERIDIISYFNAVYTHANDYEYKAYRNKKLSDEEIEETLITYCPHYYTNMFTCLCRAKERSNLNNVDLMELSSVYHQPLESLQLMVMRSRTA